MNIFRWGSAPVPQWNGHDPIDLQIKLLSYVFARLRLNKLSGFPMSTGNLRYSDAVSVAPVGASDEDQAYALDLFLELLLHDEYRVLVDFLKNKFRSYCILHSYPTDCDGAMPPLLDYKHRALKDFRFLYLATKDTTVELIASTLASSDIYCEHRVSMKTRYQYALHLISSVLKVLTGKISVLDNVRNAIIRLYLETMAFNVQLNRIYDETIKKQLASTPVTTPISTPTISTPPTSPRRPLAINNDLSPTKRPILKSKPSILKFQLESLYKPQLPTPTSPMKASATPLHQSPPRSKSPTRPHLDTSLSSAELRDGPMYEKCRLAVQARIDSERLRLH